MAHTRWPMELERPVTAVHGGMVARVVTGRPSPTTIRSPEGCSSTGESRRARCARKKERRWGGVEWPTERKSPASSAMLRRAIPVEGGLTTGNWCEHGLREEEAGLGARWRRRWCTAVAGTAMPVSSRAAEPCGCGHGRERGREGGKREWRGRRCGRLEGGRARAREGAIGRHPAGVAARDACRGRESGAREREREEAARAWAGRRELLRAHAREKPGRFGQWAEREATACLSEKLIFQFYFQ
jgi:hypothetical protein